MVCQLLVLQFVGFLDCVVQPAVEEIDPASFGGFEAFRAGPFPSPLLGHLGVSSFRRGLNDFIYLVGFLPVSSPEMGFFGSLVDS